MSEEARLLLNLFLPFYAVHCVEQVYFVYGNVLKGYGLSSEATGWILGVFFMTVMAVRPFGSWVLENFGIQRTLVWGSIVSLAGSSVLLFTEYAPVLFLGRALIGVAFGIYTMGLFAHQAIIVPEKMRGATFALIVSGGMLPTATVAPLGEWLLLGSHTRLYLAIGPILSVVCWYFGRKVRDGGPAVKRGERGGRTWGTYRDLLSSRTFALLAVTGLIIALVDAIAVSVSLLAAERGLVASYFLASASVTSVIVRVAGARTLNILPRAILLAPCGILMSAAMLITSLLPSNFFFMIGGFLYGVGIGAGWPMLHALLSDSLEVGLRPKGTAAALLLYDCGWFITPIIVGYASPVLGITRTFGALAIFTLVLLALLQIFYWVPFYRAKKRASETV
jgi:MFS family permease